MKKPFQENLFAENDRSVLSSSVAQRIKSVPCAVIALCTIVLCAGLADWRTAVIALGCITIFALPGFLIIRKCKFPVYDGLLYGPPLGITITSLVIMLLVPLAGWNFYLLSGIIIFIISALVISLQLFKTRSNQLTDPIPPKTYCRLSPWEAGSVIIFEVILFFLFKNVGSPTPSGLAFTGLFGHDFILRGVYSVALAGHVPCDNFFFAGQTIKNYYDLWYILPATIYNFTKAEADIHVITALVSLVATPFFWLIIRNLICVFISDSPSRGVSDENLKKRLPLLFISLGIFSGKKGRGLFRHNSL